MFPENWHFNSSFVLKTTKTPVTPIYSRSLERKKVHQRISVLKTDTGVFVVFKTKHELKCQFSGNIECVCFHYRDSLTNFLT